MPRRKESLVVRCLRDGTLDVDLHTGEVFSVRQGVPRPMSVSKDRDGYVHFFLRRECKPPEGSPETDGGRTRYRLRACVRVNRLVKLKALAVAKGGRHWRAFVVDLPRGVDVNHINTNRADNEHTNLELSTERANRSRTEMTEEEYAEVSAW